MYILSTKYIETLDSLVASDEVTTFEVEKIQDPRGSARWRSTSTTPNIVGKFDSAHTVDTLALLYCNARTGDTVRVRLADTEANLTASPTYDSTATALSPVVSSTNNITYTHCTLALTSTSALWFRLDFDFAGNSDGYAEVGGIALATKWKPTLGHSRDWALEDEPRGVYFVEYAGGGSGRGGGAVKRNADIRLIGLARAEALGGLKPLLRDRAGVGPVFAMLDETEATYKLDYSFYGFLDANDFTVVDRDRFDVSLRIVEP